MGWPRQSSCAKASGTGVRSCRACTILELSWKIFFEARRRCEAELWRAKHGRASPECQRQSAPALAHGARLLNLIGRRVVDGEARLRSETELRRAKSG